MYKHINSITGRWKNACTYDGKMHVHLNLINDTSTGIVCISIFLKTWEFVLIKFILFINAWNKVCNVILMVLPKLIDQQIIVINLDIKRSTS